MKKPRNKILMLLENHIPGDVRPGNEAAAPYGTDEYSLAGGLCLEPVELTRCRTVDLEVPASSEIIIEGKILPETRVMEGPFLDYSGIPKSDPNALVFEVSALMSRRNPVFSGAAIGTPGAEDHLLLSLLSSAGCLDFHGSDRKFKTYCSRRDK